jgi:hypothetical protein
MHDPSRYLLRALRQAQLYGYLIARDDGLFHPGGNRALCRLHHARWMVRSGWLVTQDGRYKITPEGHRLIEARQHGDAPTNSSQLASNRASSTSAANASAPQSPVAGGDTDPRGMEQAEAFAHAERDHRSV